MTPNEQPAKPRESLWEMVHREQANFEKSSGLTEMVYSRPVQQTPPVVWCGDGTPEGSK